MTFYSQSKQDEWVNLLLNGKTDGYFLDIGNNLQGLFDIPDITGKGDQIGLLCHDKSQDMLAWFINGPFADGDIGMRDVPAECGQTRERQRGVGIFGMQGSKKNFHRNKLKPVKMVSCPQNVIAYRPSLP